MKKEKKTGIIVLLMVAMVGVSIFSASVMAAGIYGNEYGQNEPLPGGDGIMQRLRNRICDTLGICQGGCDLITLSGILTYNDIDFFIDGVELHFGPTWYIRSAESAIDYDQDGTLEIIYDELQGLVGTEITIEGHEQSDQWVSVFTINGEVYREPGQPIWSSQHQWQWRNRHGPNKP
ncbi:MAG: hypothetical protein QCI00_02680 [Candidatus Thermoplasmatota archaeon]|nr:hypothetical protein [Candidatus Thermoplasmatota archaeon]